MITLQKANIPKDSLIKGYLPSDYSDSFECSFISSQKIKPEELMINFWTSSPEWVKKLFKLRNIFLKPFKLNTDKGDYIENLKACILEGKLHSSISIPSKSEKETILCIIDKHLTFYLSIHVGEKENSNKTILATTLVNFHNLFGRCYFILVYPFHLIIVKAMLKYIVKKQYIN